jgi:hypothetical protein
MTAHWSIIVKAYTVKKKSREETTYTFCGVVYRPDDKPAVIGHDRYQLSWYRRGRYHRNVDLPANYHRLAWGWYRDGVCRRAMGPSRVLLHWQAGCAPTLRAWDGYSDVSAADFDWRRIISGVVDCESVWVEYHYTSAIRRCRLIAIGNCIYARLC